MKRLIALFLTIALFTSCSVDEGTSYHSELLPVESVNIPDEFEMGKTYPIEVFYYQPTSCYSFYNFYYKKHNNERTVAPSNLVIDSNNCESTEDILVGNTFNFVVTGNGSYVFKFWQGKDDDGEDQYLVIEVPVVETP
ncbi:hypothetical protein [Pseudotamlana carrageenivorans]|uniref:GOLD domain-containing protein n=1 Tax=Pseudotamlana carrageenivorans TaxID=2069432 RepID=A0A2I7SH99_9FLAO|nr:hypothetical protein [Tamlana carrageenivorans]AUS05271.1 hypothetical protein C1A40_07195 [Tamlana carrageenivorans]